MTLTSSSPLQPHLQLLKEEITPKLDSLRAEKRAFLAYQKTTTELERLTRLVKAAEWVEASSRSAKVGELLEGGQRRVEEGRERVGWLEGKKRAMEEEMTKVVGRRDKVRQLVLFQPLDRFAC